MPYNENLANRIREHLLISQDNIIEKKMFEGLSFLFKGKMSVGIVGNDLAVRVVPSKMDKELEKHNVRPMDFTNKPMKGFIYVEISDMKSLPYWIDLGIEHAKSNLK